MTVESRPAQPGASGSETSVTQPGQEPASDQSGSPAPKQTPRVEMTETDRLLGFSIQPGSPVMY